MDWTPVDLADLARARQQLERKNLAATFAEALGAPLERGMRMLPDKWTAALQKVAEAALERALREAVSSLGKPQGGASREGLHKVLVSLSGMVGGAFGLASLVIELPVTTVIMLRSIAAIARDEGEDLTTPLAQLECLHVFAIGSGGETGFAAEAGYFVLRAALARSMTDAAGVIAERGLAFEGAPVVARFLSKVAARFGSAVSEKAAAQAVPILGAAGGAAVNALFMQHFQSVARGHFTIRRLERKYGAAEVEAAFAKVQRNGANDAQTA